MLFNSLQYLLFFPLVAFLYYLLPHRFRWILLLAASYYFYMCWQVGYALLIVTSTLVDYLSGILMSRQKEKRLRRKYLYLSLFVNLGLLFTFKYLNFFSANMNLLFGNFNLLIHLPELKVLLPVGISFYTFQTLSYTFDVYNGKRQAEKHLGIFGLYVAFFPQLVAGPIERSTHLLPQFHIKKKFCYEQATAGLKLMLWGFFKKLVIADRLAMMVNTIYNDPEQFNGFPILITIYFFAFQIYCDFSAYTDIAIGSAKVMGFDLMQNFRRPYLARNIKDFWKRWHISLTSWFRDYLYIPLGGNRRNTIRNYFNILLVFMVSALWHGANWTFLMWGMLHGIYYLITGIVKRLFRKLNMFQGGTISIRIFETILTFHLITFAWIFFRARSISQAFLIFSRLGENFRITWQDEWGLTVTNLLIVLISMGIMTAKHIYEERHGSIRKLISRYPLFVRYTVYLCLIIYIITAGLFTNDEFIYFQF